MIAEIDKHEEEIFWNAAWLVIDIDKENLILLSNLETF